VRFFHRYRLSQEGLKGKLGASLWSAGHKTGSPGHKTDSQRHKADPHGPRRKPPTPAWAPPCHMYCSPRCLRMLFVCLCGLTRQVQCFSTSEVLRTFVHNKLLSSHSDHQWSKQPTKYHSPRRHAPHRVHAARGPITTAVVRTSA